MKKMKIADEVANRVDEVLRGQILIALGEVATVKDDGVAKALFDMTYEHVLVNLASRQGLEIKGRG